MDEGFACRKEVSREGLVETVLPNCGLVIPPRALCIEITENRSGRESSRVI